MANEYIKHQLKNVRCAFAFLLTPNKKAPSYHTIKLLLPKNDPQTKAFLTVMEGLAQQRFGDKSQAYKIGQIQDGDLPNGKGVLDPNFAGCWLINPKTKVGNARFRVVDRARQDIFTPEAIYGGMWVNINLSLDAYKHKDYGNKFAIYMNSVQKCKDDVPFFNGSADEDGFDNLDAEEQV